MGAVSVQNCRLGHVAARGLRRVLEDCREAQRGGRGVVAWGAGGRRGLGKSRDAAVGGDGSAERGGPLGALIVTSVDVEGTGTGFSFRGDVSRLRGVARRVYYARG